MATHFIQKSDFKAQHIGTEHLAVNDTFFRRLWTRIAVRTAGRLHRNHGYCIPISKHKIVKTGFHVHLTEAATMTYVAEHTRIPVPKVHCAFVHKGQAYIVMERIQGEGLPRAWEKLSATELERVFAQLKEMMQELRALPSPGMGVQSCVGGSLYDERVPRGTPRFGPFETIQAFHLWLRQNLTLKEYEEIAKAQAWRVGDQDYQDGAEMIKKQDGPWPAPKFTHGDLNPTNILVRGGDVVGIIDWETAGWYPHYWEYTSTWFGNIMSTEWQEKLGEFLERPTTAEMNMERMRNKWYGGY